MTVKRVGGEGSTAAVKRLRAVFSFPHPVNEVAARLVAAMVMALTLVIIFTDLRWLMFLLAYGFLARVLTGPTLSPMGLLATRVIAPPTCSGARSWWRGRRSSSPRAWDWSSPPPPLSSATGLGST